MTHNYFLARATLRGGSALSALALLGAGFALTTPAFAQDASTQNQPATTASGAAQQATPDTQATPPAANPEPADQAAPPADQAADQPGDIVVTGSIFRRTDTETPSPVTTLTAENLQRAGINNVADAVRSISADNSGSIPTSFTNGFGAGSSAVALRGLTVNSTLTLVDGLRTANYPLADDGQRAFVDLNTIPQATIERIEVLKDGASSSYGADAIGGVVNVILKKEFTGIAGTLEGGSTTRGDGGQQRATLTLGTGHLDDKGFNVYISGEYQHDGKIYNRKRGFPYNTADLSSIGGDDNNAGSVVPGATTTAIVAPSSQLTPGNIFSGTGLINGPFQVLSPTGNCAAGQTAVTGAQGAGCEENLVSRYGEIQPEQTRAGGSIHATFQVNPDSQAYFTASYFQNEVKTGGTPSSIRAANPVGFLNVVLPATLSNGQDNPNNPFATSAQIRYLFGDIPASSEYKNHVLRAAAGINGKFGDGWTYAVDLTAAHSWLDITQRGYLNIAGLSAAVNDGTYNFVDPSQNTAAVRQSISPDVFGSATSDLDMVQAVVTKELFQLPGGPLQLGVGGSIRYEAVNNPSLNPDLTTLNLNAVTAVGNHTVESAYFEVNAPIIDALEVNVSGRYDHYQEGYSHFSPKVGAKFTPIPQLAIRGTYSKGFRAPSFAETAGSVVGFTSARLPCTPQGQGAHGAQITQDADGNNVCTGGSAYNQAYSIGFNTRATPEIKPELSRSFTGGVVVQPARWLSFTADYYNIKKTRVITGGPLSNDALDAYYAGTPLPEGYSITPDAIDPAPEYSGAIRRALFVNSPYANAAALKTSGIDVSALVQLKLTDDFRFSSRAEATHILHYDFKSNEASPYVDYAGTQAPYITSSGAGTPDWRGNWQNTVEYGPASLSATAYYTSGYKAVAADQFGGNDCATSSTYQGSDPNFNCKVKKFITVDLVGNIKVNDKFDFYINVVNLLDEKAPLNAGNYAATNYNPTYSQIGAVGRFFRFGTNFKF